MFTTFWAALDRRSLLATAAGRSDQRIETRFCKTCILVSRRALPLALLHLINRSAAFANVAVGAEAEVGEYTPVRVVADAMGRYGQVRGLHDGLRATVSAQYLAGCTP